MKLVLMSCCAPCSAGAIKQLADGQIPGVDDFIVLFFNPNIFPAAEYDKRLAEQIKYCDALGVKYAIGEYDHNAWRDAVRGLEDAPERGRRCSACFKFRFDYARQWAAAHGYDAVTSVVGLPRQKTQTGEKEAGAPSRGAKYLPKKGDKNLRQQFGRKSHFSRQNYCGCKFKFQKAGKNKPKITTAVPVR